MRFKPVIVWLNRPRQLSHKHHTIDTPSNGYIIFNHAIFDNDGIYRSTTLMTSVVVVFFSSQFVCFIRCLGSIATEYSDVGRYAAEDRCCREHDLCPYTLSPGECKRGLCNQQQFTRSHCDCDAKFRRCLQGLNTGEFILSIQRNRLTYWRQSQCTNNVRFLWFERGKTKIPRGINNMSNVIDLSIKWLHKIFKNIVWKPQPATTTHQRKAFMFW